MIEKWGKSFNNDSVTVRHKNVQSNVPVGHIMISSYCWHSNVNKSFEIEIGSEQNVNCLKTVYFKGRPSMRSPYVEAAFMKIIPFTFLKISDAFNLPWHFLKFWNVHQKNNILAKKQHGNTFTIFFHPIYCTQNLNWICFLDNLTPS